MYLGISEDVDSKVKILKAITRKLVSVPNWRGRGSRNGTCVGIGP